MALLNNLYYLRNHQIDKALWDARLVTCNNHLIYAKSYYLTGMAANWDAIVTKDYSILMPLPWKKKYGINYIYQPPFLQQAGVFSTQPISADWLMQMLQLAQQHFKFGEYFLNYKNPFATAQPKANYVLPLNNSYHFIASRYKQDLQKNLKKSARLSLTYSISNNINKAIDSYKITYGGKTPHVTETDYKNFEKLCTLLLQKNEVLVREVTDAENNLLSIALCLKDEKRLYLLLSTTTPTGRSKEANHFLLDHLIREFANQELALDFEGSDIAGIAHFYKNFGSANQPYYFYRWNNLPWPIRLIKG